MKFGNRFHTSTFFLAFITWESETYAEGKQFIQVIVLRPSGLFFIVDDAYYFNLKLDLNVDCRLVQSGIINLTLLIRLWC